MLLLALGVGGVLWEILVVKKTCPVIKTIVPSHLNLISCNQSLSSSLYGAR